MSAHVCTPRCDHTPVDSYATRGLRLWAAGKSPHGPRHAWCLICADTRAYLSKPAQLQERAS